MCILSAKTDQLLLPLTALYSAIDISSITIFRQITSSNDPRQNNAGDKVAYNQCRKILKRDIVPLLANYQNVLCIPFFKPKNKNTLLHSTNVQTIGE